MFKNPYPVNQKKISLSLVQLVKGGFKLNALEIKNRIDPQSYLIW